MDKEYFLFEGVTNIEHTRLSHNSQIKERFDLSAKASGHSPVVIYAAASHLYLSVLCKDKIHWNL